LISYIGSNKPSPDGRNALSLGGHDTLSVGKSRLTLQGDGNIVLYNSDGAPWASNSVGSGGRYAVMQPDGNFVLYNNNDFPLWSSQTNGRGSTPYCLALFGYGHITLYDSDCTDLWHAGSEIKQNPDGSCVTHNVVEGDNCDSIASTYGITIDDIITFNKGKDRTWGFKGCGPDLQRGKICVSTGDPPAPDLQKDEKGNAVQCGYGVFGNGTNVKCPLNLCCSRSGFCGMTSEFCGVKDPSANPGVNDCQDECEFKYKQVGPAPSDFKKIGYYESWNKNWPCLNMDISALQQTVVTDHYTHVHYSFVNIAPDYTLPYPGNDFVRFSQISGTKKIASFGGWAFSTEANTTWIFVDATKPANRGRFISSLVEFARRYSLDGLDFDWEYPGASDIPGAANNAGPQDGSNYLAFLRELRQAYKGSISIAAPASFWYLKGFPIKEISEVVDYIVYMTYDLHGQWDAEREWTKPLLRSHVDWEETMQSLTMISAKAGVESRKVILGLGTYGRSFQPADINCDKAQSLEDKDGCRFTGTFTVSNASPGRCTGTSGYISNAEIQEIRDGKVAGSQLVKAYYDSRSDSEIMTYTVNGNPNWVSYMTETTMNGRMNKARGLGLGGTVEWAMDLLKFTSESDDYDPDDYKGVMILGGLLDYDDDDDDDDDGGSHDISKCRKDIKSLEEAEREPQQCASYAACQALLYMGRGIRQDYNDLNKPYRKFGPCPKRRLDDPAGMNCIPIVGDDSYATHFQYFFEGVVERVNWNIMQLLSSAEEKDGKLQSNFRRFVDCHGKCYKNGITIDIINEDEMNNKLSKMVGSKYNLTRDSVVFNYKFGSDKVKYHNFPVADKSIKVVNPMKSMNEDIGNLDLVLSRLENGLKNNDEDFFRLANASSYVVIPAQKSMESIKAISEEGRELQKRAWERYSKLVTGIVTMISMIILSFAPIPGAALAADMFALAETIKDTDSDVGDLVLAVIPLFGSLKEAFRDGKKLTDIMDIFKNADPKVTKYINEYIHTDARMIKIQDILRKERKCLL
jgi:GH18 family chitinase